MCTNSVGPAQSEHDAAARRRIDLEFQKDAATNKTMPPYVSPLIANTNFPTIRIAAATTPTRNGPYPRRCFTRYAIEPTAAAMNNTVSGVNTALFINIGTPSELSKPAYAGQQAGHVTCGSKDNPKAGAVASTPRQPDRGLSLLMVFVPWDRGLRGSGNRPPARARCTMR